MSPKCTPRSSVIACLALLGLACGQTPGQAATNNPEENENPSSTTAPVEPPPPKEAGGVLDQIPKSAFLVLHSSQLEKSAGVIKSLLEKVGGVLDSEEVKQGLEKLRAETGIDPFDPDVLKKLGIDSSKGLAFAVDSEFTYKSAQMMDWAAMAELERQPAAYAVLALSDPKAFYAFIKETIPQKAESSHTFRFEDDLVGDLKVVYVYQTPKASGALTPGGEAEEKEADIFAPKDDVVFTDQVLMREPPARGGIVAKRAIAPRPAPKPRPPKPPLPAGDSGAPEPLSERLPPPPPPAGVLTEKLVAALVNKGDFVYAFFLDDLSKPSIPEIPDLIATFKDDLRDFFAKTSTPITKEASFLAATKKISPQKNFFFYIDSVKTEAVVTKTDQPELIYLIPKDPAQQASQESEKKWRADAASRSNPELDAVVKTLVAAVPAFALSAHLDEKKAELTGLALVGSAYQTQLQKVLVPSAAVPAYGTLFPESTTLFYRYSLDFLALKEMIFSLLPPDVRKTADEGWQKVNAATTLMAGLDIDKDILGAFTGHVAAGTPSLESFIMPYLLLLAPGGTPPAPQIPEMLAVMQLTSPGAGDKLLTAVEKLLTSQARIPVKTEEADGNKIYSVSIKSLSFAWGRAGDLLFLGNNAQALKDAFGRQKTPGASFADKLSGDLSKDLVTHASASGLTFHLGNLLGFLALQPKMDEEGKEVMSKLSKLFGALTFHSHYDEGGLQFSGELTLQ